MGNFLDLINYQIAPLLLIIFLTPATQFLVWIGRPESSFGLDSFIGNEFSWKFILAFCIWALIWLRMPSKKFTGPILSETKLPIKYQANGEFYYFTTITGFLHLSFVNPSIPLQIFENMSPILATLNCLALSISAYLWYRGYSSQSPQEGHPHPVIYQFYHGLELSPRIFGVDVKQFTNCRLGMMLWQVLIVAFFLAQLQQSGFCISLFVNVILQSFYIFMFFRWETGYFNTLDFTMDKTGWMLVWGCLVWIPSLYTFSSYFLVNNSPKLGVFAEGGILILGLLSIWFHSEADRQKESFKNANGKQIQIWGKPAKTLEISYRDSKGQEKTSQLLISGWWGVGRKMNYSLDILSTLSWSLCAGFDNGVWPFACWIFVAVLLVHRVFRDEEKCRTKYGKGWDQYCEKVKYRVIPYIF